jgi:hypothetical protein
MPETLELLEGGGGGTELLELLLGAELELGATDELLGDDTTAELPGAMLEELGSSPPPLPPDEQERVNVMARPKPAASAILANRWV